MKKFWYILKCFGIAAGSVVTLYGVFAFFDGIRDDVSDVKEEVMEFRITNDSILILSRENDKRIRDNEEAIEYNSGQIEVVVDSYLEYIKNDDGLTKDEFVEYMDPFLEYVKKNSSSTGSNNWIHSDGNDFVSTNTTGNQKLNSSH